MEGRGGLINFPLLKGGGGLNRRFTVCAIAKNMALHHFGLHMGIDLTNILFLSETGYGFQGNYRNV